MSEDEKHEADMLFEDLRGWPAITPETYDQHIKDLEDRLVHLAERIENWNRMWPGQDVPDHLLKDVLSARQQLDHLRALHEQRN